VIKPKSRLGYMYGLRVENQPYEAPLPTNSEDFFYGRQPKRRMAGDILNLDLTNSPGTPANLPLPKIGRAELRLPVVTD
jgi:hypothetical protein